MKIKQKLYYSSSSIISYLALLLVITSFIFCSGFLGCSKVDEGTKKEKEPSFEDPNTPAGGGSSPVSPTSPQNIFLSAIPMSIKADGISQSKITAVVTDSGHHPVSNNTLVNFTISSGSAMISPYSYTSKGLATATLTSSTTAGPVTIRASAQNASKTLTLACIPGDPARLMLIPAEKSLPPDGSSQTRIKATVTDAYGNMIKEPVTVHFTTSLGTITESADLDPNAQATAILTAGKLSGTAVINAKAGTALGQTVVNISSVSVSKISISAMPASLEADAQATSIITAQVMDPNNNPVPDNTPVSFIIINGRADSGIIQAGSFTFQGTAKAIYTSGTSSQTVTIQAISGSKNAQVAIELKPLPPASLSLSSSSKSLQVGELNTATITATVKDDVGTLVSGAIIIFSTDLGGISPTATTDTNGSAKATFTAGTISGPATITATAGNVSGSIVITIEPGPASNIVLAPDVIPNPDPERIYIKGTDKNQTATFSFEIRDENGNTVADGVRVEFVLLNNGTGGGESLKPGAGADDPNGVGSGSLTVGGRVKTTLESGYKAGTVRVIAFIDDLINNGLPDEGEVQSSSISIAIADGLPDGETFSAHPKILNIAGLVHANLLDTVYAKMTDRYHNPVPAGTAVYFTSDYALITPREIVPDSDTSEASAILKSMGDDYQLPPDGFVTITTSTQTGNWGKILCLAAHPVNPDILYAGTDGGGIFKTENATDPDFIKWLWVGRPGAITNEKENGLRNGVVRDIKILKSHPHIIYAATDGGVFMSTSSGSHWENMSIFKEIKGEYLGDLGPDNFDPNHNPDFSIGLSMPYYLKYHSHQNRSKTKAYLNGIETKYYTYTDSKSLRFLIGGNTGVSAGIGDPVTIDYQTGNTLPEKYPVYALALDPDPMDLKKCKIYAALYGGGVYKSENSGYDWKLKSSGLSNTDVLSLAIDPVNPNILYAGTLGGGVYITTDSGENWTETNNGLTDTVINSILVDPVNTNNIYAGTLLGGMFRSPDQGKHWYEPDTDINEDPNRPDITNTYVKDIAIDPNGILYAATYGDGYSPIGGVFKSLNNGIDWERVDPGSSLSNSHIFCLEQIGPYTLFAGTYKRFLFKSANCGQTWRRVNILEPDDLYQIFTTTQVLFSGETKVYITPMRAFYQGYGEFDKLFNTEYQDFIITVSDNNGNPITGGSSIVVAVDKGKIAGQTGVILPDTQYGHTEYHVTWTNDSTDEENINASLTVNVTSENGNATAYHIMTLVGILSISPVSKELDEGGGIVEFFAKGGSDPKNYIWTTSRGTFLHSGPDTPQEQIGGNTAVLMTTAAENGKKITVSVKDIVVNQKVEALVTQGEVPLTISPKTKTLSPKGGRSLFVAAGGSKDPNNYVWTTDEGIFVDSNNLAISAEGVKSVYLKISPNTERENKQFTVTVTDTLTDQTDTADITQEKFPELTIEPSTYDFTAEGGTVTFTASGGSEDPLNYKWSISSTSYFDPNNAQFISDPAGRETAIFKTHPTTYDRQYTITLKDSEADQTVDATVSQAGP